MNQAYVALDFYKEALQMTHFIKDVQLMAEAKAKIGRIIYKILKNNEKARVLLYEAVTVILKEENEHLKQMEWGLNAQRDLKSIQDIKNDGHIEYGKQYEEALKKLDKEYKKNKPA
jgi:tetratricopeptide (TPR) repeat protein